MVTCNNNKMNNILHALLLHLHLLKLHFLHGTVMPKLMHLCIYSAPFMVSLSSPCYWVHAYSLYIRKICELQFPDCDDFLEVPMQLYGINKQEQYTYKYQLKSYTVGGGLQNAMTVNFMTAELLEHWT